MYRISDGEKEVITRIENMTLDKETKKKAVWFFKNTSKICSTQKTKIKFLTISVLVPILIHIVLKFPGVELDIPTNTVLLLQELYVFWLFIALGILAWDFITIRKLKKCDEKVISIVLEVMRECEYWWD